MSSQRKKLRRKNHSHQDPEYRSASKSFREATTSCRKMLRSVDHAKGASYHRTSYKREPATSDRSRTRIDKILRCSIQKWQQFKKKDKKKQRRQEKEKEKRTRSLKQFNEEVRQYNRDNFRTEPLEQPPWGIDQQRLKDYARKILDMQKKIQQSTSRKSASGMSMKRSVRSPNKQEAKGKNSDYFARTSRVAGSSSHKNSNKRPLVR